MMTTHEAALQGYDILIEYIRAQQKRLREIPDPEKVEKMATEIANWQKVLGGCKTNRTYTENCRSPRLRSVVDQGTRVYADLFAGREPERHIASHSKTKAQAHQTLAKRTLTPHARKLIGQGQRNAWAKLTPEQRAARARGCQEGRERRAAREAGATA